MIVKPPNKSKQLISNVELVHPKKYPTYWNKCFDCHEKGHFSWAIVCKYSNKQHLTCRVESESDSRGISDVEWYSSDDNPDTESTKIQDENVSPKSGIRQREIRKISKQPRYHATIVLKENTIPGADISTMSLKCAKSIQFLPANTKKKYDFMQACQWMECKCTRMYLHMPSIYLGVLLLHVQNFICQVNHTPTC